MIDFTKHAIAFFKKYKNRINDTHFEYNFECDSLNYVRKENDFRYKDKLEGDTLVMVLEDLGYIKFTNRKKDIRYHIITEKGIDFLILS